MTRKSWYVGEVSRLRKLSDSGTQQIERLTREHREELDAFAADVLAVLGAVEKYPDTTSTVRVTRYVSNEPGLAPADAQVEWSSSRGYPGTEYWSGRMWVDEPVTTPGVRTFIGDVREAAKGARGADALTRIKEALTGVNTAGGINIHLAEGTVNVSHTDPGLAS